MAQVENTKRTPIIETMVNEEAGLVRFDCINGESLTVCVADLPDGVRAYAALHGLKQKLIDAAAIPRDPETGKSATPDDKWLAVMNVARRLMGGDWNAPRGEGGGASGAGLLFRALSRLYPAKTADELRTYIAGKSKVEQAALRENPKIKPIIEAIKAEMEANKTKTADVDTDAMLSELED